MASCDKCGDEVQYYRTYSDENGTTYCRDCWNIRGCEELFEKSIKEVTTHK